jgi:hypothetical protein
LRKKGRKTQSVGRRKYEKKRKKERKKERKGRNRGIGVSNAGNVTYAK